MKSEPWGPRLRLNKSEEPKTLTDATLHRLRRDIISGKLVAGQKLRAQELMAAYSVGTSPLREALFQLVSDGLVLSEGQRGFQVANLSNPELLEITEWRAHLECIALSRAIEQGDVEWEAVAVAAFHRLKRLEEMELDEVVMADLWEDRHTEFHFALYQGCGSPWLLRFCEMLGEHAQRYRRAFVRYRRITPSIMEEHKAILDAAIARRQEEAVGLLDAHIRHASDMAQQFLASPRDDDAPANTKKTKR